VQLQQSARLGQAGPVDGEHGPLEQRRLAERVVVRDPPVPGVQRAVLPADGAEQTWPDGGQRCPGRSLDRDVDRQR
jgi:hypothetical protein